MAHALVTFAGRISVAASCERMRLLRLHRADAHANVARGKQGCLQANERPGAPTRTRSAIRTQIGHNSRDQSSTAAAAAAAAQSAAFVWRAHLWSVCSLARARSLARLLAN